MRIGDLDALIVVPAGYGAAGSKPAGADSPAARPWSGSIPTRPATLQVRSTRSTGACLAVINMNDGRPASSRAGDAPDREHEHRPFFVPSILGHGPHAGRASSRRSRSSPSARSSSSSGSRPRRCRAGRWWARTSSSGCSSPQPRPRSSSGSGSFLFGVEITGSAAMTVLVRRPRGRCLPGPRLCHCLVRHRPRMRPTASPRSSSSR